MLASRLCSSSVRGLLSRPGLVSNLAPAIRNNSGDARAGLGRFARRKQAQNPGLKERAMAPQQGTAINMGQGALAGAAALGLGALAYYGAGMSGEMGAVEKSVMWPEYVRQRIKDTYM